MHVGVGAVADLGAAEPAHRDDREADRQLVQAAARGDVAQRRPAAPRRSVASVVALSAAHTSIDVGRARAGRRTRCAAAPAGARRGSRATAAAGSSCRAAGLAHRAATLGRVARLQRVVGRRASAAPRARGRACGRRSGWCRARSASRDATASPSRSSRRYHGVVPSSSDSLPVGEQPGVRVGRVGEVGQQHRQQRALQRGPPGQPAGQRLDVAQRGVAGRRSRARRAGARPRPVVSRSPSDGTRATASSSGR